MRRWPLIVILALAPLWLIGTLYRGAWTPDEPREADISWRMSLQNDRTLPQLAGTPFLEKPPLSYWMSAASLNLFGDSPAAARVPNIVYAAIGAVAIGALALAMESAAAAVIAALVAGTAITSYRVAIWLAPDAALLAGCAIGLLGGYLGFTAPAGRRKLFGYTLLHAGAALGFMAKSAPGWLVPGLALLTVIAWERRWSELRRWELYVGILVQLLLIGPWIYEVARGAAGSQALQALFWNNLVGRFTKLSAPPGLDYTSGHKNIPGKYLLQLPIYLLPWTFLALAALVRAWQRVRTPDRRRVPWRFAIAAIVPFLVLLSVAATARDIYAAPLLPAFGLLIALWATEPAVGQAGPLLTPLDRLALLATQILVGVIVAALVATILILAIAEDKKETPAFLVNAAVILTVAVIALRLAYRSRGAADFLQGLAWTYIAFTATLTLAGLTIFPVIDRWQDLPALAQRIHDDTRGVPLALLQPDETTIAILDYRLQTPYELLAPPTSDPAPTVAEWLHTHGPSARVLVKLPGRAPAEVSRLLGRYLPLRPPDDGTAATLAAARVASIVRRYELPEGRRYALLGPMTPP